VAVLKIVEATDSSDTAGVPERPFGVTWICPQACKKNARIKMDKNLRHTLAVYHNKPGPRSRLSLSEYKLLNIPIQPFAGKIARVIYQWRSECASLS
jgi:hypothetical protein